MKGPSKIACLTAAAGLLAFGCGDSGESEDGATSSAEAVATSPTTTESQDSTGTGDGESTAEGDRPSSGGAQPEGARAEAVAEAEAAARAAYSAYIEAINARDGEALCGLLPPDAVRTLKPPVERGDCASSLSASIGYRDPRGYPVWERTALSGFESVSVGRDLEEVRLTAAIVTDFADRSEPSVESDIAYLETVGGEWRLAKPSAAVYRAIGRPEPPPDVISPPAGAPATTGSPTSILTAERTAPNEKPKAFRGRVEQLSPKLRRRMTGVSWHEGCPVGLGKLRLVSATYLNFDGRRKQGRLVVHERYARGMVDVLARAFAKRFPIRRMELIDRYGGDDHRSMRHDNTSAFNCRFVNGTTRWSMHAYGKAIDVNPRENPYVSGDYVSPPEGRPYANRSDKRKGMLYRNGTVANSMQRIIGWQWGGNWRPARDYQHFSSNGG